MARIRLPLLRTAAEVTGMVCGLMSRMAPTHFAVSFADTPVSSLAAGTISKDALPLDIHVIITKAAAPKAGSVVVDGPAATSDASHGSIPEATGQEAATAPAATATATAAAVPKAATATAPDVKGPDSSAATAAVKGSTMPVALCALASALPARRDTVRLSAFL